MAHGIRKRGDLVDTRCHGFDAFFIEHEAVEHGVGKAFFPPCGQVVCVRGEDFGRVLADGCRHGSEDGVLLLTGELCELISRLAGLPSHLMDGFLDAGHDSEVCFEMGGDPGSRDDVGEAFRMTTVGDVGLDAGLDGEFDGGKF